MRFQPIKLVLLSFIILSVLFLVPQKAEAFASEVTGQVRSFYTNAPVVGIWVKWTDGVGGYRYAKTDSTGTFFFESISILDDSGERITQINTPIDTNLDGTNDDNMMYEIDPVNAPVWDFSCGSNDHSFTGVAPAGMPGTFTTVSGIKIDNGNNTETLTDIIFTPDIPPSPTPTPTPPNIYSVSGNVFVDKNQNGLKDNGESNYPGTPTVNASRGIVSVAPGGLYTITKLTAGPLTISFPNVPLGYSMINPLNGPPPTLQVTVGAGVCNTNGAKGANCN